MDKELILMSKEATEIRELWKPQRGDKYFDGDGIELLGLYTLSIVEEMEDWFWVPHQEDLQTIAYEGMTKDWHEDACCKDLYIMDQFVEWYNDHSWGFSYDPDTTITKLWFHFTMKMLYNKFWNKGTKKWELSK